MLTAEPSTGGGVAESLCLTCGLCCNGVIFADVRLQPGDNPKRLRDLGFELRSTCRSTPSQRAKSAISLRFAQPCRVLEGCKCRAYEDRPRHCREFECVLLKSMRAGATSPRAALEVVRDARQRAGSVVELLRELKDSQEERPLSKRFKRVQKRFEENETDADSVDTFAALTLAVHYLNLAIGKAFYPGDARASGSD